jgi:hypothetical protein
MNNSQIEAKIGRMASDMHVVAAPLRIIGRLLVTMAFAMLAILLFPAIIIAIIVFWRGFAFYADQIGWGVPEFLLWLFGGFAGTLWLFFVALLIDDRKNGIGPDPDPEIKTLTRPGSLKFFCLTVLSYAFGAVSSFDAPSGRTFIHMLVALMLPGTLFVLRAATQKCPVPKR